MGMDEFWKEVDKKESWSKGQLRNIGGTTGMFNKKSSIFTPEDIRVGDIFSSPFGAHPALVISVEGNWLNAVIMSTTEAPHNIYTIEHSRFFRGNFVTYSIFSSPIDIARTKYLGYIDNKKDINNVMKALKARYRYLFSEKSKQKVEVSRQLAIGSLDDLDNFD